MTSRASLASRVTVMTALAAGLSLAMPPARHRPPQRVWQADVRVQTLEITEAKRGGPVTMHIVVATGTDEEARAVRMEIMLPIGVGIVRIPTECKPSPSPVMALNARVICELGDVPVRGLRDVTITTTARPARGPLRFAVFAVSDTPDPVPANNFSEKVLP